MKARHVKLVLSLVIGLTSFRMSSQETPRDKQAITSTALPQQQALQPGDFILAEIYNAIDARKAHPGDPFQARVKGDIWTIGKIILPHDAMLVGRILEAQPYSKTTQESKLLITLDKAVLKDGTEFPLRAVVHELVKSSRSQDNSAAQPWMQSAPPSPRPANGPGTDPFFNNTVRNQRSAPSDSRLVSSSSEMKVSSFGTVTVFTSTKEDIKLAAHTLIELRVVASRQ